MATNKVVQPFNPTRGALQNAQGGTNNLPGLAILDMRTSEPAFFMAAFPFQFTLMEDVSAVDTDTYEMLTLGRNAHAIHVYTTSGTFSATVLVEGTLDGIGWTTVQSITAAGITQITGLYQALRVSVTVYTSGTFNVVGITQRC